MKNLNRILLSSALLIAFTGLAGCGGAAVTPEPPVTLEPVIDAAVLLAEGRIVPRDSVTLYSGAGGTVEEILSAEGDRVSKGAVLLRLGDREAHLANLAAAKANVAAAEQESERLRRTSDASYHLALLDEAAARKAYDDALKAWNDFNEEQFETDLDNAQADVDTALSDLEDAQKEFDKYADRVKDNPDRKRTKRIRDDAQAKYDEALRKQHAIENKHTQAKSNLEAARGRLAEAERTRKQRENGPDAEQWALAQANLDAARARYAAAQTALNRMDIIAPFDGVVARIDVSAGENVLPNQPVIAFADLGQWYVETTDLTEIDVVHLKVGQLVIVVPDALSAFEISGVVEHVGLTYIEKSGDIVYPVRIRLERSEATLFWGMTVEVRFFEE